MRKLRCPSPNRRDQRDIVVTGDFGIDLRQVPGPSTRIDLTGIQFSAVAPSTPPFTIEPHLVVIVHCPYDSRPTAALEVVYKRAGEQIARNVQPLTVEPGKFAYRLVKAELEFDDYGTVEAKVRIDLGHPAGPDLLSSMGALTHVVQCVPVDRGLLARVTDQEAVPALVAACVASGERVYAAEPRQPNLEDVYFEIEARSARLGPTGDLPGVFR